MPDKVGMRLWLSNRETPGPRVIRCSIRNGQKQNPTANSRALPLGIDKRTHAVSKAQPAVTMRTMFSASKQAARSATAELTAHPGSLTAPWSDAPVEVANFDDITRHRNQIARRITDEYSATWIGYDFGFACFIWHRLDTLRGIKNKNPFPLIPPPFSPLPLRGGRRGRQLSTSHWRSGQNENGAEPRRRRSRVEWLSSFVARTIAPQLRTVDSANFCTTKPNFSISPTKAACAPVR